MEEPNKTEIKRNPDGTFTQGTAPGPGRPTGQTLKEYWRKRFYAMTDEEKLAFSVKVGNEQIWKMAEGMPKQDVESKIKAEVTISDILDELENGHQTQRQIVEAQPFIQNSEQTGTDGAVSNEPSADTLPPEQVVQEPDTQS